MKRVYLHICATVALALMVSSCTSEDIIQNDFVPTPSNSITFGASGLSVEIQSRGNESTDELLEVTETQITSEDGEFSLPMVVEVQNGIHCLGNETPESRGAVLGNITTIQNLQAWASYSESTDGLYIPGVTFAKGQNGVFFPAEGNGPYLWPGDGSLDFVTVYPANSGLTANVNNNKLVSFDYVVPPAVADQQDIVVARVAGVSGDHGTSVALDFQHIMAAVNFKVGSVVDGTINSITIKGIPDKGTFDVVNNNWIAVTGSQIGGDGKPMFADFEVFSGTFEIGNNTIITSEPLMMIPQQLPSGAELEVLFTDGRTNKQHTLRASIQGSNWAQNTTTNYKINIDGDYNLQIVALDNLLDSHYIITKVEVSVAGIQNWELEVSSRLKGEDADESGRVVTIEAEANVNSMAKQGYWTDQLVKRVTDGYEVIAGSTARGTDTYSGSGNVTNAVFYVFIPENITGKDREITVRLKNSNGSAQKVLTLVQNPVKWIGTGVNETLLGAELLLEGGLVPWGFSWTGVTETFNVNKGGTNKVPPGWIDHVELAMKNAGIDWENFPDYIYMVTRDENGNESYTYIDENGNTQTAFNLMLRIDYEKLAISVNVGTEDADGHTNTWGMYNFDTTQGGASVGIGLIDALKTFIDSFAELQYTPGSSEVNLTGGDAYAALNALKRNRFNFYNDDELKLYIPIITEDDANWYLPAKTQYTDIISGTNWGQQFQWNDFYWTSTKYTNTNNVDTDTGQAYVFNNGAVSPVDRTNTYQAMAVRRYTNDAVVNDVITPGQ